MSCTPNCWNITAAISGCIAALIGIIGLVKSWIAKKKANPVLVVLSMGGGCQNAAIRNYGQADARKIKLTFLNAPQIVFDSDELYETIINPQQQFNISFASPKTRSLHYTIEWEDDWCKNNKKEYTTQILQIL